MPLIQEAEMGLGGRSSLMASHVTAHLVQERALCSKQRSAMRSPKKRMRVSAVFGKLVWRGTSLQGLGGACRVKFWGCPGAGC